MQKHREALLSSRLIPQGPVSSGVLFGCADSGGSDCQGLLSVMRGAHLAELGLMLSIRLDDFSMLNSQPGTGSR